MREYLIPLKDLCSHGLAPPDNLPYNQEMFSQMDGALTENGTVHEIELPSQIDTSSLEKTSHPFPQIFRLISLILVCTPTKVYEYSYVGDTFDLKITAPEGSVWSVADYDRFVVITNGRGIFVRDGLSGNWSEHTNREEIPSGICVCNLYGQLIIGGPGVQVSAGFMRSDI